MPRTSAFTRYGHLAFSSKPSHGESIYLHGKSLLGGAYDLTVGTEMESKLYADSMGYARARYTVERAQNNAHPATSTELIPVHEKDWGVVPPQTATIAQRRAALTAAWLAPGGALISNLYASLTALLGAAFLGIRVIKPTEALVVPASPAAVGQFPANLALPKKVFFITSSIAPLGFPGSLISFTYQRPGNDDGIRLQVNDKFTIDVENYGLAELCTVTASQPGASPPSATAFFTKPHSAPNASIGYPGPSVIVGPCPTWFSSQHYVLIVGTAAAATNVVTRAQVDELMRRELRGPTQWAFVEASAPHQIGPFTLGLTPLSTAPLGTFAF